MKLRPIYLIYDSGITESERKIATETVREAARIYGHRNCFIAGTRPILGTRRVSIDAIVDEAESGIDKGYGVQKDVYDLWESIETCKMMREAPFICVFITSRDITVQDLNFCFGYTRGTITVNSVARFRCLRKEDEALMIWGIIMHELGHVFGLATGGRAHTEENLGPHCTNYGCTMNQGLTLQKMYTVFRKAAEMRRCYCPECANQLMQNRFRF